MALSDAVSFDRRSFRIHGRRVLLSSGSVHYPRCHPSMWAPLFRRMRRNGLNTLETYVFWGEHDRGPHADPHNRYDFEGPRDLFRFIRCAADAGLFVILRIGPYVCAEINFGGFPPWLRDVPGIVFRTFNGPFMDHVEQWVTQLARRIKQERLLAPDGGPIIMCQLENEYSMKDSTGKDGDQYLQWIAALGSRLDLRVPTIMCYGAAEGVIETINAFYAHKQIDEHRRIHPDQPPVWTECWTGWYDVWGVPHHQRPMTDLAYSVARFFAAGGAGVNYYMYFGGTNWADPMYLQVTSYDYDAPLNESWQDTPKSRHLARLHEVLRQHFEPVLCSDPACADPTVETRESGLVIFDWGGLVSFVCNDTNDRVVDSLLDVEILASSVLICKTGSDGLVASVLYDSGRPGQDCEKAGREWVETERFELTGPWQQQLDWLADTSSDGWSFGENPTDQILLCGSSEPDYAVYQVDVDFAEPSEHKCRLGVEVEAADFVQVYWSSFGDGSGNGPELVGRSEAPLWEDRFPNRWNLYSDGYPGVLHTMSSPLKSSCGTRRGVLTLVCCNMGMVKGEWQLGASLEKERKGVLRAPRVWLENVESTEKRVVEGRCNGQWRMKQVRCRPRLASEVDGEATAGLAGHPRLLRWEFLWDGSDDEMEPLALNLLGMKKGLLWVNDTRVGRYWLVLGERARNGFLEGSPIVSTGIGEPTQLRYFIPPWVLRRGRNDVVLLDEIGDGDHRRVRVDVLKPVQARTT